MSDQRSPGGTAHVREFVNRWQNTSSPVAPSAAERALIEEALTDYLLDEGTELPSATPIIEAGLTALLALAVDPATAAAVTTVRGAIMELGRRLERQEDANLIMREHLVMLSQDNRQLRSIDAPPRGGASCR